MADEKPRTIVPRPSVVADVATWPDFTPTKIARLRRILADWPPLIESSIRARHPELADTLPHDAAPHDAA